LAEKTINFLDLSISISEGRHEFGIFRKPTHTDITVQGDPFCPPAHKYAAYYAMIHRLVWVPLSPDAFQHEVDIIRHLASINHINLNIDNLVRRKLITRALDTSTSLLKDKPKDKVKWCRVPYLGGFSSKFMACILNRINSEGQLIFVDKFFTNTSIETLHPVLRKVKPLVEQPNIKGWILFSFLKAAKIHAEDLAIEKLDNSDSEDLLYLSQILKPVRALFEDKNNASPISFLKFVRFIHRCEYQPKEAASIASEYTEDIPNLLSMLDKSYPLITNPYLNGSITRIQTALKKKIAHDT